MNDTDEAIGAFVDGELGREEADALLRRAARNEGLAREIERQRALRGQLLDAFAPAIDEPVPARLTRLLAEPPRPRLVARGAPRFLAYGVGMAATVALAVGVALSLRPTGEIAFTADGSAMARGQLARALDNQLGAEAASDADVRLMASFQAADGRYCRLFQRQGAPAQAAGLACRNEAGWAIAALSTASAEASGGYRQAASSLPAPVVAALEDAGAGSPLTAAEEAAARSAGWRAARR